ncbi:MAG TPA: FMN-binding negative transcriptional regulator [Geminicoccus sp.]|jgi:transcriptional regulator|uniref:FMN-binding negative transcriptional regulator n=1 Tax=Geminicoccus sp. TaxID=2024832 RepID=UPI002E2F7A8E|nr:FMN-binding negative transcriptional regulator [Geminicoccus sp.]HEX2528448.1 FMN-binding negative transcriptional regulator [Geminicoccus sp.]
MYQPTLFREDRLEVQHALIRAHPLGLLVSAGPSGLMANLIPFLIDPAAGERGTLRAHLARANGQWEDLRRADSCLVVFQGAERYITPSWYATKMETGKVVPTWNYAMVQAWGRPAVIEDQDWLRRQIADLTAAQEAARADPWAVDDAPAPFIAAQLRGIVGVEIPIDRIEGKWKVSQNRPMADRAGVHAGLQAEDGDDAMAALVADRGGLPGS